MNVSKRSTGDTPHGLGIFLCVHNLVATSSHWCVLSCAQWGGKWEFEVGEHRIEEENRTRASEVTVTRDPKVVISGLIQSRQACGSKTDGPAFLHRERRNPCTRSLPLLICQRCVCREREYSMQRVLRHDCTWHAEKNKTMRKIVITRCATAREHEKLPNGKSRLGHIIGDSLVVGRLNDMVHCPLRSRLERQWSLSNFGSTDFRRLIFWRCVCVVITHHPMAPPFSSHCLDVIPTIVPPTWAIVKQAQEEPKRNHF